MNVKYPLTYYAGSSGNWKVFPRGKDFATYAVYGNPRKRSYSGK